MNCMSHACEQDIETGSLKRGATELQATATRSKSFSSETAPLLKL